MIAALSLRLLYLIFRQVLSGCLKRPAVEVGAGQ
jgi:hypothetical protein